MNTREYYANAFKAEKPKFVRVLQAVPGDQGAYRPHPKSSSAGDIVWLLASELKDACDLVDNGQVEYVPRPAPGLADSVAAYERNAAELEKRLGSHRRRRVGPELEVPHGRQGRVGVHARRHALRLPLRRDPSPWPALVLPAADGAKGPLDLRPVGGRSGNVTSESVTG